MPFEFNHLAIPDVILVSAKRFPDDRGFFVETYKRDDFESNGILETFVQDNHSRSTRGVLRGLHYQKAPHAPGQTHPGAQRRNIRRCRGYASGIPHLWSVDRHSSFRGAIRTPVCSPRLCTRILRSQRGGGLHIQMHGYLRARDYRGISWNDPDLNISWPIKNPILSKRDQNLPPLKEADNNFIY